MVVEDIINMDKPDVLQTGMLVQVKWGGDHWWTGKFVELPATQDQLDEFEEELNQPLTDLKRNLKELKQLRDEESNGPDRPKWVALYRSSIDEKKQEIVQYKRQARQKYERLQRGLYVVEDNIANFMDTSSTLKKWEFVPYGDDTDEWRFPDCPLINLGDHIRVSNADGVFEPVTVTEVGQTNFTKDDSLNSAPEHIVSYERESEPGVAYTLNTWYQQYKLGWDDEKTEKAPDDPDYIHSSEEDENDSDMDVWENLYNESEEVVVGAQRGTVLSVDDQNRSYTITLDDGSARGNVKEDEIVPSEQLQYGPGRIVLYDYKVCRIIRLNADNYTLEQSPHQADNIEALFDAFQDSNEKDWRTFLFTGAKTVNDVTDDDLQKYCLIKTNGIRSVCKKNGTTQLSLKLLNANGTKRSVVLDSKNIQEPEEVNDIIEAMFRQEEDEDTDKSYLDFDVGQAVEVYDNEQKTLVHRRLSALQQELSILKRRLDGATNDKWKSFYRSEIDQKNQEIMRYQGLISDQWPIGTIVKHQPNNVKEQDSYQVQVNGTTKIYSVSQLGALKTEPSAMSGAAKLAAGVDEYADAADVEEYIYSETEDIPMSNSADEHDANDSGMESEWVPIVDEIGALVKMENGQILSVVSFDYDNGLTKMSDGNKYTNEQFDIYIEDTESEPDDPSSNVMDDETDSEDSEDELQ